LAFASSMSIYRTTTFFLCFLLNYLAQAQSQVEGQVMDSLSRPISNASVLLYKEQDTVNFKSFKITDDQGRFTFEQRERFKFPLRVKVLHISYQTRWVEINTNNSLIQLRQKSNDLKPIVISADKPLRIKGDTLSYAVSQWKTDRDTSIEDVIERIPGVTIDDAGTISYNGKRIRHLYINGLDLLENRYTIATKGLPADGIRNIEVLRNHTHKKNQRSLNRNRGVSLNLETKDKILLSALSRATLATPLLNGQLETTPIAIHPDYQLAGSLKASSYGKDHIFNDGRVFNFNTLFDPSPSYELIDLIAERRQQNTNLDQQYWRNADALQMSVDGLKKLGKDKELKISYSTDFDQITLSNKFQETIQLDNDTIFNKEINNYFNITRNHYLKGKYEINTDRIYGKLHLYARNSYDNQTSSTQLNANQFDRQIEKNGQNIFLAWQQSINNNNKLWSYDASLQYKNSNDQLQVFPEVFDILDSGNLIRSLQDLNTQESLFKVQGHFFQQWKGGQLELIPGYEGTFQQVDSRLDQSGDNSFNRFPFVATHDYDRHQLKLNTVLSYKIDRWTLSSISQLYYLDINSEDNAGTYDQVSDLIFEPSVILNYDLTSFLRFTARYNRSNSFADLNSFQTNFIIRDYNSNSSFNNRIQRSSNNRYAVDMDYKNILKSLFGNLGFSYQETFNTLTTGLSFDPQGFRIIEFRDQANTGTNLRLDAKVAKNISAKLLASLTSDFSVRENVYFLNGESTKLRSDFIKASLRLDYDPQTWFFINTEFSVSNTRTSTNSTNLDNTAITTAVDFSQLWSDTSYTQVTWNGQRNTFLNNKNTNNLFDLKYVYRPSSNQEFSIGVLNVLNQENFTSTSTIQNITSVNSFRLLGRQFIVSYKFQL